MTSQDVFAYNGVVTVPDAGKIYFLGNFFLTFCVC